MPNDIGVPEEVSARVAYLCSEIRRHKELYYVRGYPEITDDQYDELLREFKELEAAKIPVKETP